MALYNLTAGILDQVVTSLQSPAQLDEIQQLHQFLSTDSRVQMLIFSAMTSSSCNYLLSRLSSKRGTALLSFVVVFTVISVLASSTLSSFVFGQPHGWLTNNQVPWAIAVIFVQLAGGNWLHKEFPLISVIEKSIIGLGTASGIIRTFETTTSTLSKNRRDWKNEGNKKTKQKTKKDKTNSGSMSLALILSGIIPSARVVILQLVDIYFFEDKSPRKFRHTKCYFLYSIFYMIFSFVSIPTAVSYFIIAILVQIHFHTNKVGTLIDKIEDFLDSFFALGNQEVLVYQIESEKTVQTFIKTKKLKEM